MINRLMMAIVVACSIFSTPASAVTAHFAGASIEVTYAKDAPGVVVEFAPLVADGNAEAIGDFGTFASTFGVPSFSFPTNVPILPLSEGENASITSVANGGTASVITTANVSRADSKRSTTMTVTNNGQGTAKVLFNIVWRLAVSASLNDPTSQTAKATGRLMVAGGSFLEQQLAVANANTGSPGGNQDNASNPLILTLDLLPSASQSFIFSVEADSESTATPVSAIPLPAAAPLLLSGLGLMAFAARRRRA